MASPPAPRKRRWLTRALFGLLLIGIGAAIHALLPFSPRWSLTLSESPRGLCLEGRAFLTVSKSSAPPGRVGPLHHGPLRVRDLSSGRDAATFDEALSFSNVMDIDDQLIIAPDGRTFAAWGDSQAHVFDVHQGKRLLHAADVDGVHLSPTGRFIALRERYAALDLIEHADSYRFRIVECKTGRRVSEGRWNSWPLFSPDDRWTLHGGKDHIGHVAKEIELWSLEKGERVAAIPRQGRVVAWSPDGRWLITDDTPPRDLSRPPPQGPRQAWVLWDLEGTNASPKRYLSRAADDWESALFSPDSKWFVSVSKDGAKAATWDAARGEPVWQAKLDVLHHFFADDSRWLAVQRTERGEELACFATSTGERLWTEPWQAFRWRCFDWTLPAAEGAVIGVTPLSGSWAIRDLRTGKLRASKNDDSDGREEFLVLFLGGDSLQSRTPSLTPDRRFAWWSARVPDQKGPNTSWFRRWWPFRSARAAEESVTVLDIARGKVIAELEGPPFAAAFVSHDGRLLLTSHENPDGVALIEAWDLPLRKPWGWSVGIPAALGLTVLAWPRRQTPRGDSAGPGGVRPRFFKLPLL